MKITEIRVHSTQLPIEGGHRISGGRSFAALESVIVAIVTDKGLLGLGEGCPLGNAYLPAFPGGIREGMQVIGPALIGQDPRQLANINAIMDRVLMGHPYVKSPIDMACWDILGKASNLPVSTLLGGRMASKLPFRAPIPVDDNELAVSATLDKYRAMGMFCYNIKVGNDPKTDLKRLHTIARMMQPHERLFADANRGWSKDEALVVLRNVPLEYAIYFEQPCARSADCAVVRDRTQHLIVLDEQIDSVEALLNAWKIGLGDAVNLKISRVGGISQMRILRDLCMELGTKVLIQDNWASGIASAAVAHLAYSTPERWLLGVWGAGFNVTLETARGAPIIKDGAMIGSDAPGLGITPNLKVLGEPIATYS